MEACENESARSLSREKTVNALKETGLKTIEGRKTRRINLCKEHYKKIKKIMKKERKLDQLRW